LFMSAMLHAGYQTWGCREGAGGEAGRSRGVRSAAARTPTDGQRQQTRGEGRRRTRAVQMQLLACAGRAAGSSRGGLGMGTLQRVGDGWKYEGGRG
jgi:hypothetical protein